jgi:hypothetical protein
LIADPQTVSTQRNGVLRTCVALPDVQGERMALHSLRMAPLLGCAASSLLTALAAPAAAQESPPAPSGGDAMLQRLEESVRDQAARLDEQSRELERQRQKLAEQQAVLKQQLAQIARLKGDTSPEAAAPISADPLPEESFGVLRAGQAPPPSNPIEITNISSSPRPEKPVGEAPPPVRPPPTLEALPDNVGVLTPASKLVIEPSFEYANFSTNRLVFRGVEIITGVQIGLIEASDVDRNTLIGTLAARVGVTDRIEFELRAPYVYRNDEIFTLAQRDNQITRTIHLEGHDVGDVEVTGRYQLTSGRDGTPVWIANLRYKTNTGKSPFEVGRDANGIATELPTGSGFWAIEPGVTFLMPSDPAVLFANLGYLCHAADEVNRTVNGVFIGEVDPGDSINASLGFGFAVNQRFSFSMGYRHNYIFQTESELGATRQSSDDFHAGALQFGLSYRLNNRTSLNANFDFGVTEDAPDVRIVFRVPLS